MVKEKRILSYILGWLIVGFIIIFMGVNNVFALTNKTIYSGVNESGLTGSGYYNYGYINEGGVQNISTAKVGNTINGISYGFQFYYYEDIILNNTYTLKINFKDNDLLKTVNSNYFEIQTCNNDNCSNATIISLEKENQNSNSSWAIVKFNPINKGNIISVNIGTDNNEPITGIQTFGISSIQTEYSNFNQDIIDNNNNNTNNIIDNNNNNTNNIIDSIQGELNSCRPSINLFNINSITNGYYYNADLVYSSAPNTALSDFINVSGKGNVTLSFNSSANSIIRFNYFNLNKEIISQNVYTTISGKNSKTFSIPNNISYVRFSYNTSGVSGNTIQLEYGSVSNNYEEFGKEICQNKIDETNDKLDGIQGALTDDSPPNISGLQNSAGWLPPGPLDSVLNLPLSLFNALTTNLNKSCNPINIPLPFVNKNITLPCINTLYNQIGISSFLSWIGVIVSGFMLYTYLLKLYKWIEDRVSLNETHNVDSWGGL